MPWAIKQTIYRDLWLPWRTRREVVSCRCPGACHNIMVTRWVVRLRSASSTDVVIPATRRSSLGDGAFPVGRRSSGMERVTAQCHLRAASLFITVTSENVSVSSTSITCTQHHVNPGELNWTELVVVGIGSSPVVTVWR